MSYSIIISKSVQKQISNLPSQIRNRVIEKRQSLVQEPRPSDVVKLKGYDKEYSFLREDYLNAIAFYQISAIALPY